ncbi:MAG: hypothetical protein ABSE71_03200 [Candidatus Micrarchaeaceae archaeon]|jgi:hypothetical protein
MSRDILNKTALDNAIIEMLVDFPQLEGLGDFIILIKDCTSEQPIRANGFWEGNYNFIESYSTPFLKVETHPNLEYPFKIDGVREKGYLSYVVLDRKELILYLIAHELRNLWQARNKTALDNKQSETDADSFAIKTVKEWRKLYIPQ